MGNENSKKPGPPRDKRKFLKEILDRLPEKSIEVIYCRILPIAQAFLKREKLWKH